jgi:hypothetical protein
MSEDEQRDGDVIAELRRRVDESLARLLRQVEEQEARRVPSPLGSRWPR